LRVLCPKLTEIPGLLLENVRRVFVQSVVG
jgi:hypothetical protein